MVSGTYLVGYVHTCRHNLVVREGTAAPPNFDQYEGAPDTVALSPGHSQLFVVSCETREGLVCEMTCIAYLWTVGIYST